MEALFSPELKWLWSAALGSALFFPVRQLIWVLSVRRLQRRTGELPADAVRKSLKRHAGMTSLLLCLVCAAAWGSIVWAGGGP
ncbi:MAG: hypothetical protein IIA36_03560 [Proteobacteria bacterium]|nr:hypothetical protein [Pseudomonadota bacterium]